MYYTFPFVDQRLELDSSGVEKLLGGLLGMEDGSIGRGKLAFCV